MKVFIITLYFFVSVNSGFAQNNPIFFGGSSAGWDTENYTQTSVSIFTGGNGAGWNKANFNQSAYNIFTGGANDGWVFNSYIQAGSEIYNGGINDGWSNTTFLQPGNDIFKGGKDDGWAFINYLQAGNNIFNGGANDGWASTYRPMGPLPVSLLSFTVQKINQSEGLLKWSTTSEINSSYFDIERSFDALNFEKIGRVEAAGNSSQTVNYNFTDINPVKGFNYYRLKQTDIDGRFVFTPTRMLRFDFIENINIKYYPNPTNGNLNIAILNSNYTEQKIITLSNSAGAVVSQIKVVSNNKEIIPLNFKGLPKGVYFIQIKSERINSTRQIVIN